ncbi:pathogenesis-related genes transcriptional activator [Carpediemonas membranifera]|uniref:Pathogenesis-related genes transcriptional activator n=1 Tax=Carpediemonas membranifera TaxID=201153 RepID=A0A8J6EB77_9EUKA|nr:pathogenesis-related genes transcriptional activator [Carpediemonas membranifera]|eukprot:KAG9396475.1 pathogenesis-related genes transcriptional activator [Carpediemonas membranifera]
MIDTSYIAEDIIAPPSPLPISTDLASFSPSEQNIQRRRTLSRDLEEYTGCTQIPTPQFRPEPLVDLEEEEHPPASSYAVIHQNDHPNNLTRRTPAQWSEAPVRRISTDNSVAKPTRRASSVTPRRQDPSPASLFDRSKQWQAKRQEQVEQAQKQREQKELEECSFKPKINKRPASATRVRTSNTDPVTRLYREGVKRKQSVAAALEQTHAEQFDRECTFTPKTNKPRALRDREGVFDRLYESRQGQRESRRGSHDGEQKTAVSSRESFDAFISRQQRMEFRKRVRREEVLTEVMCDSTFRPKINPSSTKMADAKTDAWSRLTTSKTDLNNLPDGCTFTPRMYTRRSKQTRGRSVMEMSVIDSQKVKAKHEKARKIKEEADLEHATFTPQIVSRNARSRLNVLQDPNEYLRRLDESARAKEETRQRVFAQRAAEEVEECTFRPRIRECPAFVKNVAARRRIMRDG